MGGELLRPCPIELDRFRSQYGDDPDASEMSAGLDKEIAMFAELGDHYGYIFYIARRG